MKRSLRVLLAGLFFTFTLSFTPLADATAPSLVSPENGTTIDTLTPRFDWSDVEGARSYTLEVATDKNFSNIVLTKSTIESAATLSETEKLSYGTHYYWRGRGTDNIGTGDWSSTWSFTAKLAAPKVTSFEIAAGATYTNSTDVQLTITAQNAAEMSFSNDGVVWDEWESFQDSKSYTLSTSDGTKNVYIRVRDNVGDISQTAVGSITLYQTPPSTTYSLSGDLGVDGFKDTVVVTLTGTDATSGVESTKYRLDNGEWQAGVTFVISREGWHLVKYYSTDAAGNTEGTKKFELKVYTPSLIPSLLSQAWWALLSIVATSGVVSVFVARRVRFAGRLKGIKGKKAELLKLKRRAQMRYFHEGTISRDSYDALIEDYERRKAKLENEQSLLLAKRKRKRKG